MAREIAGSEKEGVVGTARRRETDAGVRGFYTRISKREDEDSRGVFGTVSLFETGSLTPIPGVGVDVSVAGWPCIGAGSVTKFRAAALGSGRTVSSRRTSGATAVARVSIVSGRVDCVTRARSRNSCTVGTIRRAPSRLASIVSSAAAEGESVFSPNPARISGSSGPCTRSVRSSARESRGTAIRSGRLAGGTAETALTAAPMLIPMTNASLASE